MKRTILLFALVGCSTKTEPQATSVEPSATAAVSASAAPSASASLPTSEPERTFAMMQAAACDANPPQFFKHVDRTAIVDHAFNAILEDVKKKLGRPINAIEQKALDEKMAKERDTFFDEWEKDIDRGPKGYLCQWEKLSVQGWKIKIRRTSGTSTATFAERDGAVKMIGFLNDEEDK